MTDKDNNNTTEKPLIDENLFMASLVLLFVFGLAFGGSTMLVNNMDISTNEMIVTGSTTTDVSETTSVISYGELPETEQTRFRDVQPRVYNTDIEQEIRFSSNTDIYSTHTHISLDGTYYEIDTLEQPTNLGVILLTTFVSSKLAMFVAGLGVVIGGIFNITKFSLDRLNMKAVKEIAIIFVILCTLIGVVTPIAGFTYSDPLTVVESTNQQQEVTEFTTLSSDQQENVVNLVSGSTISADDTTLERGMTVRSDGELYTLTTAEITSRNIIIGLVSGLFSFLISGFLAFTAFQMKLELLDGKTTDSASPN
jgi:hypothetical protein